MMLLNTDIYIYTKHIKSNSMWLSTEKLWCNRTEKHNKSALSRHGSVTTPTLSVKCSCCTLFCFLQLL